MDENLDGRSLNHWTPELVINLSIRLSDYKDTKMTTDRVLTIFSIIIGLPAFLSLFINSTHRQEGILCLLFVFALIGFRWWWKLQEEKPQFTSIHLHKQLTILTPDGRSAKYVRTERMRANFKGIGEWWNRNICQDGTISGILIDNEPPFLTEESSGKLNVCKRFSRALEKGEEITIKLSFDQHDSYIKSKEALIHNNVVNAKEVIITIELPRPCIQCELRRTYGGEHGKLLEKPLMSLNNCKIEAKIKKPQMGASYHVEWTW